MTQRRMSVVLTLDRLPFPGLDSVLMRRLATLDEAIAVLACRKLMREIKQRSIAMVHGWVANSGFICFLIAVRT